MKGQISVEFLASSLIFIMAVVFVLNVLTGSLPEYLDQKEEESINVEMKRVSDHLIKTRYDPSSTNNVGIASDYMVVSEDNLNDLGDSNEISYSEFKDTLDLDHSYNFIFTVFPVVDTSSSNPSGITEPVYSGTPENVRYGTEEFGGSTYHFLTVRHDQDYDTVYVSENVDFSSHEVGSVGGNSVTINSNEYEIENLQNEGVDPGSSVVLSREVKEFGAPLTTGSREVINRYVTYANNYNNEMLMRIRVTAW